MAHPTFTQPEALRLAENLGQAWTLLSDQQKAAAELRRLYAANIDCVGHFNAIKAERDELLEALKKIKAHFDTDEYAWEVATAAIVKATGGQA